jgi:hypothetical protein
MNDLNFILLILIITVFAISGAHIIKSIKNEPFPLKNYIGVLAMVFFLTLWVLYVLIPVLVWFFTATGIIIN